MKSEGGSACRCCGLASDVHGTGLGLLHIATEVAPLQGNEHQPMEVPHDRQVDGPRFGATEIATCLGVPL